MKVHFFNIIITAYKYVEESTIINNSIQLFGIYENPNNSPFPRWSTDSAYFDSSWYEFIII
jgi:hypothetical protein